MMSMLVRKLQKKNKSLVTSISLNIDLVLVCVFVFLPGVADRNELTSLVVVHVPLWKNLFDLVIAHFTQVTLLNPQSIECR